MNRWIAVLSMIVAATILITASVGHLSATMLPSEFPSIGITLGCTLLAVAIAVSLSSLDDRTPAQIRLDWFLPHLRRRKSGQSLNQRWCGRLLRVVVPPRLLSNHETKQRGALRRYLRRFGISWLASPLRRLTQATCLILFLVSFFYVCWPYRARPAPPGRVSAGWRFSEIDQQTGEFQFNQGEPEHWLSAATSVYLHSNGVGQASRVMIARASEGTITLLPAADLSDDALDAILTGQQTWSIHEFAPDAWPSHYADDLADHEVLAAELFLAIDPLVSLSTAIASRSWVWSLTAAAAILLVCVVVPRGFCGYICPLGTTIDLFDWAIASRTRRFQVPSDGWWVHIKYYLLATTLIAAACGVLVSGFVSAIPVITRALLLIGEPLQSGTMRGWHLVPAIGWGHLISIGLFVGLLCLGFLRRRFWCKYVCPSGAIFSLGNLFRITERKVESSCIHCNKCIEICPFDAIKPDFTTRTTDCTMCQSCGGVCPTHAIKFVERWNVVELKAENDPPTHQTAIGRRGFLSLSAGTAAAVVGGVGATAVVKTLGASQSGSQLRPVRPPGSVPEQQFLQMCIRCGECFKACPNNVLQPEAFEQGIEGLWTPRVEANWAGCDSSCNCCGQVCPTGAIRALPLEEKKAARMGLAIVNPQTCLPMVGREPCDLCVQECNAAGYRAIEYIQVGTEVDEQGMPIAGSGMLAPVVLENKCVGCGLCQTRCYGINAKERGLISESAIIVEAGEGKEDRLMSGSYRELRQPAADQKRQSRSFRRGSLPESSFENTLESDLKNPFGL